MKTNKKFFLGIIVGILFSSVGVYAATTYLATDISYTPSNTNWNVNNVGKAIDELYNRNKYCVSGTIDHSAKTQWNIDVGFIPSTFHMSYQLSTGGYRHFIYNKNLNKKIYLAGDRLTELYIEEWAIYFDVSSTTIKTTFPNTWPVYNEAYKLHYTVCK